MVPVILRKLISFEKKLFQCFLCTFKNESFDKKRPIFIGI